MLLLLPLAAAVNADEGLRSAGTKSWPCDNYTTEAECTGGTEWLHCKWSDAYGRCENKGAKTAEDRNVGDKQAIPCYVWSDVGNCTFNGCLWHNDECIVAPEKSAGLDDGSDKGWPWCRNYKTERDCEQGGGWPHCKWDGFHKECVSKDKSAEAAASGRNAEKSRPDNRPCMIISDMGSCYAAGHCIWIADGPNGTCVDQL